MKYNIISDFIIYYDILLLHYYINNIVCSLFKENVKIEFFNI